MVFDRINIIGLNALLFSLILINGCVEQQQLSRHQVKQIPKCESIIHHPNITDADISFFLDQSIQNDSIQTCWMPLMKRCLNERITIPRQHLIMGIKKFNQSRHEKFFHLSVYRYFKYSFENNALYNQSIDRPFLDAYCKYAIRRASSKKDHVLMQAQLICQRVDPWLYEKLFTYE